MGQQPSVTLPNSVDDVSYDADSNTLTYTYYDGTKKKVSLNSAPAGVGINSAYKDTSNNLIFGLSNQTTLAPIQLPTSAPGLNGLNGQNGVSIKTATKDSNNNLILGLSDGTSLPPIQLPIPTNGLNGQNGVSIKSATKDSNNNLILGLSDGTTLPGIQLPSGKDGKDGDPQNRNFGDGAPITNGWGGFKASYGSGNPWVINDNVSNRLTRDGIDIVTGRSVVNNMFVGPSQIYFPNKGKCLSVASDKVSPLLDNCANTPNQLWYKNINTGHIYNAGQQKCLQSTQGGRWKLVGCDTQQANQYFQFPDGSIKTPNTGKCLDSSQDYWNNDCNKSDTQYVLFTPFNIADRSKVMYSPINTGMNEPNIQ